MSSRARSGGRIGYVLNESFPRDLVEWTGGFSLRIDPHRELEWAYRQLVITRSTAVADCFEGIVDRCWDAMGLAHQDEWMSMWYSAGDRIAFVANRFSADSRAP